MDLLPASLMGVSLMGVLFARQRGQEILTVCDLAESALGG